MERFELINTKPVKGFEKHEDGLLELLIANKAKVKPKKPIEPSKSYKRRQ